MGSSDGIMKRPTADSEREIESKQTVGTYLARPGVRKVWQIESTWVVYWQVRQGNENRCFEWLQALFDGNCGRHRRSDCDGEHQTGQGLDLARGSRLSDSACIANAKHQADGHGHRDVESLLEERFCCRVGKRKVVDFAVVDAEFVVVVFASWLCCPLCVYFWWGGNLLTKIKGFDNIDQKQLTG